MPRHILIIGHPLCAEQNRLPFLNQGDVKYTIISPADWKSPGLNRRYRMNPVQKENSNLIGLNCLFSGHNSFFIWKKLKPVLKDLSPDIIYCWEEPWCLSAFQVAAYSRNKHIPLLFYSAENKHKKLPFLFGIIQNYVYKKSAGAIVPTLEAKNRLLQSGFPKNIYIIPLWIYRTNYIARIPSKNTGIYIGRLIPLKGVDILISSLPLIPDFGLIIIGDGPEKASLEALAAKLDLKSRVRFCGVKSEDEIESYKSKAALSIFPTRENKNQAEQFGKAAVECLASGLPVLCSNTGNFSFLSRENPICYSKKLQTALNISEEIKNILRHFPEDDTREKASVQILNNYSPLAVSQKFLACWENVL